MNARLRDLRPIIILAPILVLGLGFGFAPPPAEARSVGNPDCREKQYGINIVLEVTKALKAAGFLKGPASGELSRDGSPPPQIAKAIEAYRSSKGLARSPRIDLDLLRSLLGDRYPLAKAEELSEVCDDLVRRGDETGAETQ